MKWGIFGKKNFLGASEKPYRFKTKKSAELFIKLHKRLKGCKPKRIHHIKGL